MNSLDINQTETQKDVIREIVDSPKLFDFSKIKIVIKRGRNNEDEVTLLDRIWAHKHIPHFRSVIEGVSSNEGIEITLTCNQDAFNFTIACLQ